MLLPEKGVILSLRFKKYVYTTLTITAIWQLLLYFIIPSGWTIVFSIYYLAVMASRYFDPGQSRQVDSMCTGLTLNYIFLLTFISTFILRLILNFSWEDTTCGVIFTFMVSAIAYIASVFELSLKDYPVLSSLGLILSVTCWLIFIAFYMTTKDKHKYKKLVYFNRASLFIVVYTYSIVTKSVVFLCVSLTIALLKLLVSKVFKDSIKEQVSKKEEEE